MLLRHLVATAVLLLPSFGAAGQPLPPEPPPPFFYLYYPQCSAANKELRRDEAIGAVLATVSDDNICSCTRRRIERDERFRPLARADKWIFEALMEKPENRDYVKAKIAAIRFGCISEAIEEGLAVPSTGG